MYPNLKRDEKKRVRDEEMRRTYKRKHAGHDSSSGRKKKKPSSVYITRVLFRLLMIHTRAM
jgi:hypothetical protein